MSGSPFAIAGSFSIRGSAFRVLPFAVLAAAALVVCVSAQQQTPSFRFERPIVADGAGARRLRIDVPLLAGAARFHVASRQFDPVTGQTTITVAGGMSDLRLYDADGRELGYLLVDNPPVTPTYKPATLLPVAPVDTEKKKTSGFEADLGAPMLVDRMRVDGVSTPFLKRVMLEGSGDRQHWTMLVSEGTLFDLPDERLRETELRFAPGSYRYLRLTWDDAASARVPPPPRVLAGVVPTAVPPTALTADLTFERRPSEPRRSRFRVRLPAGHLPIVALEIDAGGGHVLRDVSAYEARLVGGILQPTLLGQSTLRRVVMNEVTASAMRLPIDPPSEAQIDLVVDDEDNPPFELGSVRAVFADLPWIYFESGGGSLTARYGNSQLTAPRYDLEAARDKIHVDTAREATWGTARARSTDDNAAGAAPPLPTVGSTVDASLFKYARPLPAGEAGLVSVPLDAAVLAHSSGRGHGFDDLRVIDDAGRQIPYLVEQMLEPLSIDVAPERLSAPPATLGAARHGRTVYRLKLPYAELPASRLVLTTIARVFERTVTFAVEREPDQRRRDKWLDTIASQRWIQADQDTLPSPLTVSLRPLGSTDLLVIVDEGDNAPLPLGLAHILLPSYHVRLYRAANTALRVAYGRSDLDRPHYDLALLAPQVLGTPAIDVSLGDEQLVANTTTAAIVSPRVFWAALIAAVIVLLAVIANLLKQPAPRL